jgi:hypothetical protein
MEGSYWFSELKSLIKKKNGFVASNIASYATPLRIVLKTKH